jgi:hypothetical protein
VLRATRNLTTTATLSTLTLGSAMALSGLRICVTGTHSKTRSELQGLILAHGGEFAKTCSAKTTLVLATEDEVRNATSKITQARKHGKPIVGESWLDACIEAGAPVDESDHLIDGASGASGAAAVQPASLAGPAVQLAGPAAHQGASDASQVMLAKKWSDGSDPTGWMMSEKLDGMRAYWSGENFFTRNGNQVHPPAWFIEDMPPCPLDGELWLGRGQFQRCMSILRKSEPTQDWQYVKYLVFDAPKHEGDDGSPAPFEERLEYIKSAIGPDKTQYCRAVGHRACKGQQDLEDCLRKVEAAGGEGLMLRKPGSLYEWKRSSTLLKVKTFSDEEAIVVAHEPGKAGSKNAHVLGALVCKSPDGRQFNVGSGFTDAQRRKPPAIGSVITYRYQELSNSLNPRFPVFVDERAEMDWDDYCESYIPPEQAAAKTLKRNHTILFTEGVGGSSDDTGGASGGGASGGGAAAAAQPPKKKRKSAAAAASSAAGGASAAAAASTVVLGVEWSWQSSNGGVKTVWTPYSSADCSEIEAAWAEQGSSGQIQLGSGYVVRFNSMDQHPHRQPNRLRSVQRLVTAAEVKAQQADGHDSIALYRDYKRAHMEEPELFAKAGTKMTVVASTQLDEFEWLHVKWQKTAKNTVDGWVKSRNVAAVPVAAKPPALSQDGGGGSKKKAKAKAKPQNPFAAKKVSAAADTADPASADMDGWDIAADDDDDDDFVSDDPNELRRTSSAAATAAADMAMDIAEDGIPDATQFLLAAVAPPKLSQEAAAKYCKDRGVQPPKLAVPKDGQPLVLGRGLHGITDPYMSSRQASLCVVQVQDSPSGKKNAVLEFRALGRNACLYRKDGAGSQSPWVKLAGTKKAAQTEDEEEAGSAKVVLSGGDELCLLADKTMRYKVVAAGVGGDGVNRSLTRSLTE